VRVIRPWLFILSLAGRRLRRRIGPGALVGIGIAAAAAMLAASSAGGLLAETRYLEREVMRLPEPDRAVRALWFGVPRRVAWADLDAKARSALASLPRDDLMTTVQYRQTHIGGDPIDLAAGDGLSRWVDLSSGRLPKPCRPERCEVVQVGGAGRIASVPGLRLVRVGTGTIASGVPFGELRSRERDPSVVGAALRYHTAESPPFVLAEGVEEVTRVEPLSAIFRSYGWVVPLAPGDARPWEVERLAVAVTRARSDLEAASPLYDVTAPTAELEQARIRAETGARRLLLVGGTAAALLLAFAVLAASALRRDAEAARRRLTWSGARRWQLAALTAVESGVVAVGAVVAGWAGSGAIVAIAAAGGEAGAGKILRESVFSNAGLVTAVALGLAAWAIVLTFLRAPPLALGAAAVTPLDAAALGAVGVIAFALARGSLDARALADEDTGALLLVLPGLVAFVAAVALARAAGHAFRLAERVARRSLSARLALLALARRPGRASLAASFLAVSFGLALFAETYRSSLAGGQVDQAAFAVPADFVLREDLRNLVPVTKLGSIGGSGIVRRSGDVPRLEGSRGVTLLGVPSASLARIDGWRDDFSARSLDKLGRLVEPSGNATLRAVPLPRDAASLEVAASLTGDDVTVAASVEAPAGDFLTVPLGQTRGRKPVVLRGGMPGDARGGRLVALSFRIARTVYHDRGEGEPVREPPATANLTLGPIRVGGAPLRLDYAAWVAGNGAHLVSGSDEGARLTLILTNEFPGRFRPPQPTDGRLVPVIVSPRLAAAAGAGGVLPVRLTGDQLRVRVVGVAERFPSIEGDFVVADRELVSTALNADRAGAAVVNELWLDVPDGRRAAAEGRLARPPFDVLDVQAQAAVLADLRADPLARSTLLTLVAAALVALGLALVGLLLVVVTDVRDEAAELFDLEAQGADPRMLRRQMGIRIAAIAVFGLLGGLATGASLAAVVADFVTLTAAAGREEPPLLLDADWSVLLAAAAAYGLFAGLVGALVLRTSFRGPEAGRLQEAAA
jgi:hypothetical protein